jgi:hypothetical protein
MHMGESRTMKTLKQKPSFSLKGLLPLALVPLLAASTSGCGSNDLKSGPSFVAEGGASLASVEVRVNPAEATHAPIPDSFLGFSQEWPWLDSMFKSQQMFDLFNLLGSFGTGPLMLRVGGGAADMPVSQYENWIQAGIERSWLLLPEIHRRTGMRFILTLNFANGDKELVKLQKQRGESSLPAGSVVSYEIGNEPNYYAGRKFRSEKFLDTYPQEFSAYAQYSGCAVTKNCAGPAWGHAYMNPSMLDWFVKTNKSNLNLATVHFYKDNNATPNDAVTLLDESALQKAVTSLKTQVAAAAKHGIALRIAESNSISGGGLEGVSDVYSAALWTLDAALEAANLGAAGIDFHQGSWRYSFYRQMKDPVTGASTYYVQPPFHGMLFFQKAMPAGGVMVEKRVSGSSANVKAYPLKKGAELRVVLLNKDAAKPAVVALRINAAVAAAPSGRLIRLLSPGNDLKAKTGITVGGVHYDALGGKPSGAEVTEVLEGARLDGSEVGYEVTLPPASAALAVFPGMGDEKRAR